MKLVFRQYGQGFPVVILHGLYGLSDNWVSFGRRLAADFQVIIPDLRNHGQSPHSPVFNYSAMEEDIRELLDECGFREVMLIGHSLGGKVAMSFSLDHPEAVNRLVIADISLRSYPENREQLDLIHAMMSVDLDLAKSRSDVEKQLQQSIRSQKLRQFVLKNLYWKNPSQLDWRPDLQNIYKNLDQVFLGIESDAVFLKPVLFIRGGKSDYIQDGDIPVIKTKFPRAVVETIDSATHWVHADEPGKFFDLVSDFLRRPSIPGYLD